MQRIGTATRAAKKTAAIGKKALSIAIGVVLAVSLVPSNAWAQGGDSLTASSYAATQSKDDYSEYYFDFSGFPYDGALGLCGACGERMVTKASFVNAERVSGGGVPSLLITFKKNGKFKVTGEIYRKGKLFGSAQKTITVCAKKS